MEICNSFLRIFKRFGKLNKIHEKLSEKGANLTKKIAVKCYL